MIVEDYMVIDSPDSSSFKYDVSLAKMRSVEKAIIALGELDEGWDFGVGDRIQPYVIDESIRIYRKYGIDLKCDVHPMTEGGIKLVFYNGIDENFIDVDINPDGTFGLIYERGRGNSFETIFDHPASTEGDIKHCLNTLLRKDNTEWILSGPSTLENITQRRGGLTRILFHPIGGEYQFSVGDAQLSNLQEPVIIYHSSTRGR